MTGGTAPGETEGFAVWSGCTPGKLTAEGTVVPLDADELRAEAARVPPRRGSRDGSR